MIDKLYLIPDPNDIKRSEEIADRWGAAFEYNDFFDPKLLDDETELRRRIEAYRDHSKKNLGDNLHGVFYDICLNSCDRKIREISERRVDSSMTIARKLNCRKVIFHTNFIPGFIPDFYVNGWVNMNADYYKKVCAAYPDMTVCVENMFDFKPDMLLLLAKEMADVDNFAVCFDVAHINVHGERCEDWIRDLAPYIRHLHINDNDGVADLHLPVGDGCVDWKEFFDTVDRYGIDSGMLIEVRGLDDFEKSMRYLIQRGFVHER
ncbi:MAG: sugar phosphate isomerase/epimerase [Lachnospiraceae bacterium]|nr:sugar phosphate isomerase/epimerase [Lachnospiraceae bacterium]